MKLTVDEKMCIKHKLTFEEFLIALMYRLIEKPAEVTTNLINREVLVAKDGKYWVTQRWSDVIDEILADSAVKIDEKRLELLADEIKKRFPKGTTPDGKYYYHCNRREIMQSLKRFITQYGDYPDEDILDATCRYVAHFRGNYKDMRIAKYFIIKDLTKEGKGIISDLATFLENKEEDDEIKIDDWKRYARN